MTKTQTIQLLVKGNSRDHKSELFALLKNAKRFECLVAFAKYSVWGEFKGPLEKALAGGMSARLAIGLDFYHTDPKLLHALFLLSKKYNLELYISNSEFIFHPKIYAFEHNGGCSVVIGSANFTQGGLCKNYEASVMIDDARGTMMASVIKHLDDLIADEEIVPATKENIERYAKKHAINIAWTDYANRRARRPVVAGEAAPILLADYLKMMKEGGTKSEFERDLKIRRSNLAAAPEQLRIVASRSEKSEQDFLGQYERLISLFHSGGLPRQKTRIAEQRDAFRRAVNSIIDQSHLSPRDAFGILHKAFADIKGAGINLLTEILHSLDPTQFAVMNQNSISGLSLAGYDKFPLHPSKTNVNADRYQLFCDHAEDVRKVLGLRDFTEFDALINYVYWHEDHSDDDDEA